MVHFEPVPPPTAPSHHYSQAPVSESPRPSSRLSTPPSSSRQATWLPPAVLRHHRSQPEPPRGFAVPPASHAGPASALGRKPPSPLLRAGRRSRLGRHGLVRPWSPLVESPASGRCRPGRCSRIRLRAGLAAVESPSLSRWGPQPLRTAVARLTVACLPVDPSASNPPHQTTTMGSTARPAASVVAKGRLQDAGFLPLPHIAQSSRRPSLPRAASTAGSPARQAAPAGSV